MAFNTFDTDRQAIEYYVAQALPGGKIGTRSVTVYQAGAMGLSDFLNSQTIKPPCILVAFMGFTNGDPKESGQAPRTKSYSVFVHLGQPGAASGKRTDPVDAESIAEAIQAQTEGELGFYVLSANGERRRITVDGGQNLYLSSGFDVFELTVTIH